MSTVVFGPNPLLALRALGEDAVRVELVAPEPEFVYRPLATGDRFVVTQAQRRPLAENAADRRAALRVAALERVDGEEHDRDVRFADLHLPRPTRIERRIAQRAYDVVGHRSVFLHRRRAERP